MTDKIPEFDENGLLPVGDYEVTLAELRDSILVQGPRDRLKYPSWDANCTPQCISKVPCDLRLF